MLTIDGSAGGGQVLRTALTLSVVQDRPVTIEHVRGGRDTPGLRPQHLAGIAVVAELTDATIEGDSVGAETVTFEPQRRPTGTVEIDIGTAGAITLLFEPVLSIGSVLDKPITVVATGGTDVKWSPTIDYLDNVRLPALAAHGWPADLEVNTRGYYPIGGGRVTLTVEPASPRPFSLTDAPDIEGAKVTSRASESLRTADVAERQADGAKMALEAADVTVIAEASTYHDVESTGTSITTVAEAPNGYLGGDAVGERGRPSEDVGEAAANELLEAIEAGTPVDHHLADQLLIPLAIAGGRIRVPAMTDHIETNLEVIEAFGYDIEADPSADGGVEIVSSAD